MSTQTTTSVTNRRAVLALFVGTAFLAGTPLWVKFSNMDPSTQAFLRVGIGALVLLPFGIFERLKVGTLGAKGIALSLVAGLILGVDFIAWNYSIFYVGAGAAAILLNLQVIVVPLLYAVFERYKIPRIFLLLVPIMVAGVLFTGGVFEPSHSSDGPAEIFGVKTATLGTVLGLVAGLCYSLYLYLSRKATMSSGLNLSAQPMVYSMFAQTIPPLVSAYAFSPRGGLDFTHGVLVDGTLPTVNPETSLGDPLTASSWVYVLLIAVLGQAVAFILIQYGTVWLEPTTSAGILLLSPVTAVIISAPLLGEIPSPLQILGVVMILGTVAYQNGLVHWLLGKRRKRRKEKTIVEESVKPGHVPQA